MSAILRTKNAFGQRPGLSVARRRQDKPEESTRRPSLKGKVPAAAARCTARQQRHRVLPSKVPPLPEKAKNKRTFISRSPDKLSTVKLRGSAGNEAHRHPFLLPGPGSGPESSLRRAPLGRAEPEGVPAEPPSSCIRCQGINHDRRRSPAHFGLIFFCFSSCVRCPRNPHWLGPDSRTAARTAGTASSDSGVERERER